DVEKLNKNFTEITESKNFLSFDNDTGLEINSIQDEAVKQALTNVFTNNKLLNNNGTVLIENNPFVFDDGLGFSPTKLLEDEVGKELA
ncbi:hypothetical protein, partial [Klebsiella pneumoniae]|uniref:hypothetical protein n=1 Tax=Klebsiella pneumoniae TaxID=573 RepID=UPI0040455080